MGVCAEIVSFEATDGVRLSGALFAPKRPAKVGAIYLHGNGDSSVFRSARTIGLADTLTRSGFGFLPFDNRGSGLMRWLKRDKRGETEYLNGGTAFERIGDAVHDIDGAARYMRRRGFTRLFLLGHSTGANKIVLYDQKKGRNRFAGYGLLAPGDDVGFYRQGLGPRRFHKVLERARREVSRGRSESFIPAGYSPFPMSWGAFLDTIDPDGDYNQFPFGEELFDWDLSSGRRFSAFRGVTKRMIVVYGSNDEFGYGRVPEIVEILASNQNENAAVKYVVIEGADHGFGDHHDALGTILVDWMAG